MKENREKKKRREGREKERVEIRVKTREKQNRKTKINRHVKDLYIFGNKLQLVRMYKKSSQIYQKQNPRNPPKKG